jgi:hypothetical protein
MPNIDGAQILDDVERFIKRFVVLTDDQAVVCTAWIAHTHTFRNAAGEYTFDFTPYLNISSAERRSGKTRLLEVLDVLVDRPWFAVDVSLAVLYRKIHSERPTLLLDETDALFRGDEERANAIRGLLNAGFEVRGCVDRVNMNMGGVLETFHTFCPKALSGIGRLPLTVADRSLIIELRRRRPDEAVERFRMRKVKPQADDLRQRLHTWGKSIAPKLADMSADLDLVSDRWPTSASRWP